jgi:hypothetical protein
MTVEWTSSTKAHMHSQFQGNEDVTVFYDGKWKIRIFINLQTMWKIASDKFEGHEFYGDVVDVRSGDRPIYWSFQFGVLRFTKIPGAKRSLPKYVESTIVRYTKYCFPDYIRTRINGVIKKMISP